MKDLHRLSVQKKKDQLVTEFNMRENAPKTTDMANSSSTSNAKTAGTHRNDDRSPPYYSHCSRSNRKSRSRSSSSSGRDVRQEHNQAMDRSRSRNRLYDKDRTKYGRDNFSGRSRSSSRPLNVRQQHGRSSRSKSRENRPRFDNRKYQQKPLHRTYNYTYRPHIRRDIYVQQVKQRPQPKFMELLRTLSALELQIGRTLGPKLIDLHQKAIAAERIKVDSAVGLLENRENRDFLDSIKERLRRRMADTLLERKVFCNTRSAVNDIATLLAKPTKYEDSAVERRIFMKSIMMKQPEAADSKEAVADKLAAHLISENRDRITTDELKTLIGNFTGGIQEIKSGGLTDDDIEVLLGNFHLLSSTEQDYVRDHIKNYER